MTLEVLVLAAFGVWVYGLTDVLRPRDDEGRILDQDAWVAVVFFGFVLGALGWLVLGRPQAATPPGDHDDLADDDDLDLDSVEAFRTRVRDRAEEQRRRYAEQQRSLEEDSAP